MTEDRLIALCALVEQHYGTVGRPKIPSECPLLMELFRYLVAEHYCVIDENFTKPSIHYNLYRYPYILGQVSIYRGWKPHLLAWRWAEDFVRRTETWVIWKAMAKELTAEDLARIT